MTTRVIFTGNVDHRYAWIGNDAEGNNDVFTELAALISAANGSVAVSTMTFNYGTGATATPADARVEQIAQLLADKAAAGRDVRIMGNGGHRYQAGYFRAQRGGAHVVDNNLSALVHRISFQRAAAAAPPGFLVDSGAVFGPRGSGLSYGWDQDAAADIGPKGPPDATFVSPLLRECYARSNALGPRTWSIALPPGHYYVLVATGEAAYGSKSFVLAQGQSIFLRKTAGVYQYSDFTNTGPGEFACSTVDGGADPDTGLAMARRLEVPASGRLELTVGRAGEVSWSSIDYLEIYRASDTAALGDPGLDATRVQERACHHSKFILVDAGAVSQRLWTGSHNLTTIDMTTSAVRSEDAIITDEPAICAAFRSEFDQWWGATSGSPNAAVSRTGTFKTPILADGTMPSVMPGLTASWSVRFSPSRSGSGGVDLYQTISDFLGPTATPSDILLLIEQVTDSGTYHGANGTFPGATALVALLREKVLAGALLHAAIGDSSPTESIFTAFAGIASAKVASWPPIHDKIAIVDALGDNPTRARGKVLCGSMNWSASAMHVNDEQTLILRDPAIANQYLQRAARVYADAGIELARTADCVVVIDRSFSMNQPATSGSTKIAAARIAAKLFLDLLDQDGTHRVALVRFGSTVEPFVPPFTLTPLTAAAVPEMKAEIDGIAATLPIGSSTCYGRAFQEAYGLITSAATPHSRRMVVFLSDGKENTAPMAATVYPAMAADGIEIHTTSFGVFAPGDTSGPNAILAEIARVSGGTFAQVDDDTVHLQKRFAEVARDAMGMITILDPSWTLRAGEEFVQPFPVDMRDGTLVIALLWGGQPARPEQIAITTPWGAKILSRSPGVERRAGDGREVWRIDLRRVGGAPMRDVRGVWCVSGRAPSAGGLRVELCVFASDTGVGRVVTDLVRVDDALELRVRVFGGDRLLEGARTRLVHVLPSPAHKREQPREIGLSPLRTGDRRFRGVQASRIDTTACGVHELRLVVEGEVREEAAASAGKAGAATSIPFRRERVIRWFVPVPQNV